MTKNGRELLVWFVGDCYYDAQLGMTFTGTKYIVKHTYIIFCKDQRMFEQYNCESDIQA